MFKQCFIEKNRQLLDVLKGRENLQYDPLFCEDMVGRLTNMITEMERLDNEQLSMVIKGPYLTLIRTFGSVHLKGVKGSRHSLIQVYDALDGIRYALPVSEAAPLLLKICQVLAEKEVLLGRYLARSF